MIEDNHFNKLLLKFNSIISREVKYIFLLLLRIYYTKKSSHMTCPSLLTSFKWCFNVLW